MRSLARCICYRSKDSCGIVDEHAVVSELRHTGGDLFGEERHSFFLAIVPFEMLLLIGPIFACCIIISCGITVRSSHYHYTIQPCKVHPSPCLTERDSELFYGLAVGTSWASSGRFIVWRFRMAVVCSGLKNLCISEDGNCFSYASLLGLFTASFLS